MYENTYRVNIRNFKYSIDYNYMDTLTVFRKSVAFLLGIGLRSRENTYPNILFEDAIAQDIFDKTFDRAGMMNVTDLTSQFLESLGNPNYVNMLLDISTLMDDYIEKCYKSVFMNILNITFNRFYELEITTKQHVIRRPREN